MATITDSGNHYACCRALDSPQTCVHKDRYLRVEAYVKSQVHVQGRNGDACDSWTVAWVCGDPPGIAIWLTAYEIYGWDMVTSVLIHEFGHCKLYESEGVLDGSIEAERKANEYGRKHIPPDLIPLHYDEHRRFFLKSYGTPWTREQCLEAFQEWCAQFEQTEPHLDAN